MISENPVVSWQHDPVADCFTKPNGERAYRLLQSFLLTVDGVELLVPVNHVWDDASIPRPVRVLIGKEECGEVGPCVHDYLYQHAGHIPEGIFSQRQADDLFRACMKAENVPGRCWRLAYAGVRAGGWWAWRNYEKVRRKMELVAAGA